MSWHCRGSASEYKWCCALVTTARGRIRWLSWLAGWPDNQSGTNSWINLFGPIRLLGTPRGFAGTFTDTFLGDRQLFCPPAPGVTTQGRLFQGNYCLLERMNSMNSLKGKKKKKKQSSGFLFTQFLLAFLVLLFLCRLSLFSHLFHTTPSHATKIPRGKKKKKRKRAHCGIMRRHRLCRSLSLSYLVGTCLSQESKQSAAHASYQRTVIMEWASSQDDVILLARSTQGSFQCKMQTQISLWSTKYMPCLLLLLLLLFSSP